MAERICHFKPTVWINDKNHKQGQISVELDNALTKAGVSAKDRLSILGVQQCNPGQTNSGHSFDLGNGVMMPTNITNKLARQLKAAGFHLGNSSNHGYRYVYNSELNTAEKPQEKQDLPSLGLGLFGPSRPKYPLDKFTLLQADKEIGPERAGSLVESRKAPKESLPKGLAAAEENSVASTFTLSNGDQYGHLKKENTWFSILSCSPKLLTIAEKDLPDIVRNFKFPNDGIKTK